jgi:hypothetical protein
MTIPIPQDNLVLPTGRISQSWQRFLALLRINDTVQYTPRVFASSGTITTAESQGRYQKVGSQIILHGFVKVTNNGTGAGTLFLVLPTGVGTVVMPTPGTGAQGVKPIVVTMSGDPPVFPFPTIYTYLAFNNTDGTYPTVNQIIYFSITYEVS